MKENKEFFEALLNAASPSGEEAPAVSIFQNFIEENVKNVKRDFWDNFNNCSYWIGDPDSVTVMISAHIDSIYMMVTDITDGGYLKIANGAGTDKKVLQGSRVTILTDAGTQVTGVIGKAPIHIEYGQPEYDQAPKFDELFVDLGTGSREETEKLGIKVGTLVIYERGNLLTDFGKDGKLVVGPDLDDKACVYVIAEVMRRIDQEKLKANNVKLFCVAMAQEESGTRGAKVAARKIDPAISIDLDVTFDTDKDLGISTAKYCNVVVGEGAVIEFGDDRSRRINNELIALAKDRNIKYQLSTTRSGGTNTASIQEHAWDCETTHVALALRNMHTPQEIVSWEDMESCIELVKTYIEEKI